MALAPVPPVPPTNEVPIDAATGDHTKAWVDYHQAMSDAVAAGGLFQDATFAGPVSLSNFVAANVGSMALPAGDWDVYGAVAFAPAAGTTVNTISAWISTVSAALPGVPNGGGFTSLRATFQTGQQQQISAGHLRMNLTTTTTVYLGALAGFGISTMTASGYIGARRAK
jgi:hypothetical protein